MVVNKVFEKLREVVDVLREGAPTAELPAPMRRWPAQRVRDVCECYGLEPLDGGRRVSGWLTAPSSLCMTPRMIIVGVNPSPTSAQTGVPFARKGNRMWPALLASGVATVDRDPAALASRGIAMTDLSKRVTRRADEIAAEELRRGAERLERVVRWIRPEAVVIVGVTAWRIAMDDKSIALGRQAVTLGGRTVWVLPNPSGLNAHTNVADMTERFREVMDAAVE